MSNVTPDDVEQWKEYTRSQRAKALSVANPDDPFVFFGRTTSGYKFDASGRPTTVGTIVDNKVKLSEAEFMYYDWSDSERAKFRDSLTLAGVDTTGYDDDAYAMAWKDLVTQASRYYRDGQGKQITPWDIIAMNRRDREVQGPKTTTNTSTSVNLSTKADVGAAAYDIARALLGRAPTDEEIARYTQAINAQERANPMSTTTTTTVQPGGNSSSSSSSSGGFSAAAAQDEIRKQVQSEEGYAEGQAATTYFGDLMEMLGG